MSHCTVIARVFNSFAAEVDSWEIYRVLLNVTCVSFCVILFAVKTDRKEDRRKREVKEQERRV